MDKLSDLIAALLVDLSIAQHQSNQYSRTLAERYRGDKLLRFFPVPNGLLDEAVVKLRFLPKGIAPDTHKPASTGFEPSQQTVDVLAASVARVVANTLALELESSARQGWEKLAFGVRSDRGVTQVAGHLVSPLREYLAACAEFGASDDLRSSASRHLLQATELAYQSDKTVVSVVPDPVDWVKKGFAVSHKTIDDLLIRAGGHVQALAAVQMSFPDIGVSIDPEEMARFPDHAIQDITLKATLRGYKWVVVEERPDESKLVPES